MWQEENRSPVEPLAILLTHVGHQTVISSCTGRSIGCYQQWLACLYTLKFSTFKLCFQHVWLAQWYPGARLIRFLLFYSIKWNFSAFTHVAGGSSKPSHCYIPLSLVFGILKELQDDPLTIGTSKKSLWSLALWVASELWVLQAWGALEPLSMVSTPPYQVQQPGLWPGL